MKLNHKVTLVVGSIVLVSCALNVVIQNAFITPSFLALENDTAYKNAERALGAVQRELDQLSPAVSDWAYWTDTYDFAKGENPDYIEENFDNGATLAAMELNYLGIYDTSGNAVWVMGWDLEEEEQLKLGNLTGDQLDTSHPLLHQPEISSEVKGIIQTSVAPMLVYAKPILTNSNLGPATGTMIMGRFLDSNAIARLADQTKLSVSMSTSKSYSAKWADNGRQGLQHTDITMSENSERLQSALTLGDLHNNPILTLFVDTPRDISKHGYSAVRSSLLSVAIMGFLTILILLILLRRVMLNPLQKLTDHALSMSNNVQMHSRLDMQRNDEIGILANTYDTMLDKLAEVQQKLIGQSYESGVSEMASGVLHNIGNAITPLNVRLSNLSTELGTAPIAELEQAAKELADPATSDERRADMQQFVELAGVELTALVKQCNVDVANAASQVVNVQQILSDQERFSYAERVMEPVDVADLIDSAATGLSADMQSAMKIEVTPSVAETGMVSGTRAAILQVVMNILVNAAESIQSTQTDLGKLVITAELDHQSDGVCSHMRFIDNGAGIQEEHMERLFQRGFSTKNRSGSGYGLHWSATTVQNLGGSLSIENAASGRGCCVHLRIPLLQAVDDAATGTEG